MCVCFPCPPPCFQTIDHPSVKTKEPLQAAYRIIQGTNNDLNYHRVPVPSGDRHLGQWASIRGSGAGFPHRSKGRCHPMTAKQPPSYAGKVSWFRCEELVDDWVTITTAEAPKRGPLLKSRLTGDAYMYKAVLQNDLLQDPDEGVNYFKNTLKKYFLKGATNVYL